MSDSSFSPDLNALVGALDARLEDLSRMAYERFAVEVPLAADWSEEQRTNFIRQAHGRFGAILAVTGHEIGRDDALRSDLEEVGGSAAWAGTSLGHLLMVLRISRDLLLSAAMHEAKDEAQFPGPVLRMFTQRLILATDSLLDALVNGYWSARLARQQEEWHRLASVVEGSSYGFYEADVDGILQYANAKLGAFVGMAPEELKGASLGDVFKPTGGTGSVAALLAEPPGDAAEVAFTIEGPSGEIVELDINTVVRRIDSEVVGFGGIVRRSMSPAEVVGDTSEFARRLHEMQSSLDILAQSGGFLQRNAADMSSAQVVQAGESIRRQAERLGEVVSELDAERESAGL